MLDVRNMNINLIQIALENKKLLIKVAIIAAVLSAIFSSPFFIKPKYKSAAIIYPTNLYKFSEETPIEQMIQWFESHSLKMMTINDLNLKKHYDIDVKNKNLDPYFLIKEFDENVSIKETKYQSAEITVLDTDPAMAFKIVNNIIKSFNKKIRNEHLKVLNQDLEPIKKELDRSSDELDQVSNRMKELRIKYNIINYSSQSEEVVRGYLGTFDGGNKANSQELTKLKSNLEEKGGEYIYLDQRFYQLVKQKNYWEEEYNKVRRQINRNITYISYVSEPFISYKKVYPIRWLIVLLSVFGSVLFAYVYTLYKIKSNFDSAS